MKRTRRPCCGARRTPRNRQSIAYRGTEREGSPNKGGGGAGTAGASCSPTRRSTTSRPTTRSARLRSARTSPTGTTSPSIYKGVRTVSAATASAASAASGCSTPAGPRPRARRRAAVRDRDRRAEPYWRDYDLVVARRRRSTRGAHRVRRRVQARHRRPPCKFIWLGTHQKFDDAFTFIFEETEHGWMWAHAYQFDADTATFIVECSPRRPGSRSASSEMTKEETIATCERIFAKRSRRPPLMSNAATCAARPGSTSRACSASAGPHENVVLMGDAAATAHFSIGSGTKLALDKRHRARRLPAQRADHRRGVPRATRTSGASRCCGCSRRRATPWSGSRRSSATSTSIRCSSTTRCSPARSASATRTCACAIPSGWRRRGLVPGAAGGRPTPGPRADVRAVPPARHGAQEPRRRLADGAVQGGRRLPDRLALRALRRARQGRRRPRLHRDDLRHARGPHHARLHRAVRPSTRRPGSGSSTSSTPRPTPRSAASSATPAPRARPSSAGRTMDAPLAEGNWPVISRLRGALVAAEPGAEGDDRADMDAVRDQFVAAPRWPSAGFDMLELHARTATCSRRSSRR